MLANCWDLSFDMKFVSDTCIWRFHHWTRRIYVARQFLCGTKRLSTIGVVMMSSANGIPSLPDTPSDFMTAFFARMFFCDAVFQVICFSLCGNILFDDKNLHIIVQIWGKWQLATRIGTGYFYRMRQLWNLQVWQHWSTKFGDGTNDTWFETHLSRSKNHYHWFRNHVKCSWYIAIPVRRESARNSQL